MIEVYDMGIEIITSKLNLSPSQKQSVTRFVNKNCSYYYFLNFICMTNGNVKNAIKLYHFDMDIRNIILKQSLNFELQMKKKLIAGIYKIDYNFQWDNANYYTNHFNFQKNGKSKLDKMVSDSFKRIRLMNYTDINRNRNERMLYATSLGTYIMLYNNLLDIYRTPFIENVYPISVNSLDISKRFDYFKKYLESIQLTRNRCAHSNHVLNKRFTDKISRIYLDNFNEECKRFNKFERTLYFLYISTDSSEQYKKDILKCLKKYDDCLDYCIRKNIFKPNIIMRIQDYWKK